MMPIPRPPIDEQHEFVRRASQMIEVVNALRARVGSVAGQLDKASHPVLAKAFRGELHAKVAMGEE
jgi:hypothetical protein